MHMWLVPTYIHLLDLVSILCSLLASFLTTEDNVVAKNANIISDV